MVPVIGIGNNFGPSESRVIEGVYRELVEQFWDHTLKDIELSPDSVHQHKGGALPGADEADLGPIVAKS
jgi:hypothetical protein